MAKNDLEFKKMNKMARKKVNDKVKKADEEAKKKIKQKKLF